MNTEFIREYRSAWVLLGSSFLALVVGSSLKLLTHTPAAPGRQAAQPMLTVGDSMYLGAPAALTLQPTADVPALAIASGRVDPFAPLAQPAPATPANSVAVAPPVAVATPASLPPMPVAVPQSVPQTLPPVPQSASPAAPTTVTVLPQPAAVTNPVDRVGVSGVVQLNGQVRAIVREGTTGSRQVGAGDWLMGGQVQVKRIEVDGPEPMVVLAYKGQEFYRSVGSGALAQAL